MTAAKEAMAASKYDTDGDGVCDDASCDGIVTIIDEADPYPKQTALLQQSLEPLGITLDVKTFERTTMYAKCEDPNSKWGCARACRGARTTRTGSRSARRCSARTRSAPSRAATTRWSGITPEMLQERGYDPSTSDPERRGPDRRLHPALG